MLYNFTNFSKLFENVISLNDFFKNCVFKLPQIKQVHKRTTQIVCKNQYFEDIFLSNMYNKLNKLPNFSKKK